MKNRFVKIIVVSLLITFLIPSFAGCKSQPIKAGKDALKVVGTVGEYDITYEEIYFLANSYKDILDAQYGEDAYKSDELITVKDENGEERSVKLSDYYTQEISKNISESITSNYAVLTLAKKEGVSLDSKALKKEVQEQLDLYIETEFDGSRKTYKEYLEAFNITDSYVRFTLGVDILYSRLATHYLESGTVPTTEQELKGIINTQFVRTQHVMIINEDETSYQTATQVLAEIRSGEKTLNKMIGSKYNKDLVPPPNGYYFTKGSMDKSYEDAAYALEINEVSDIVTAVGKDYYGNRVTCYYIIQRLELENEYIDKNFESLKNEYINSIVYGNMEAEQDSLNFAPNDYYKSLNILELEAPSSTDTRTVMVVAVLTVSALLVVGGIFILKAVRKNKRKKRV